MIFRDASKSGPETAPDSARDLDLELRWPMVDSRCAEVRRYWWLRCLRHLRGVGVAILAGTMAMFELGLSLTAQQGQMSPPSDPYLGRLPSRGMSSLVAVDQ